MLLHIRSHGFHMVEVLQKPAIVIAILATIKLTFEVIISRCTVCIPAGFPTVADHFLHPPVFRLGPGIDGLLTMCAHIVDAFGNMIALRL